MSRFGDDQTVLATGKAGKAHILPNPRLDTVQSRSEPSMDGQENTMLIIDGRFGWVHTKSILALDSGIRVPW